MENYSHYQKKVLDKILPPLERIDPYEELVRLSKLYDNLLKEETDEFLLNSFKLSIESKLSNLLNQDYRFQELSEYKEDHLPRVKDYIEDHYETSSWDGIDGNKELTKDYLEECISEQNTIIDKTIKHMIPIPDRESLNVMQFVSDEFLNEYKYSSKRKIKFLNQELNKFKSSFDVKKIIYDNPYPEYFNSYGYEIYKDFTPTIKKEIVYAEMSFLVYQLRKDGLMNKDKTLISIFNFMIEEFDTNFGTATKFKSNITPELHLPIYKEIKKRYVSVPK